MQVQQAIATKQRVAIYPILRFISIIFFIAVTFGCSPQAVRTHSETPVLQSTCAVLETATWQDTTLYDLTYGCIPKGWEQFFAQDEVKTLISNISTSIKNQVTAGNDISPKIGRTFRALYRVKPEEIKAIIMGQDPAPQPGLATGLAFSTEPGVSSSKVASIQRVLLEAQNEGNCIDLDNGDLSKWANNGVLLLNMALTIPCPVDQESCEIGGHIPLWSDFTGSLVSYTNSNASSAVFILWGSKAGDYAKDVTNDKHKVIKGGHPSPRVSGKNFFCKNYFNCANTWLSKNSRTIVNWNLKDSCLPATPCIWAWHSGSGTSTCSEQCTLADCQ